MFFTTTNRPNQTTLRIEGSLDALSAPELRGVIETLVRDHCALVTLDLSSLSMIDGSGIGALVSLCNRLREQNGDVCCFGTHGQPLAIFRLLRLSTYFSPAAAPRAQLQAA